MDDYSVEVLRRRAMTQGKKAKKVLDFFSSSNPIAFRLKMGIRVKTIRVNLNAMVEDRIKFDLVERQEGTNVRRREETHSSPPVVIGREVDEKIVVQLLRSEVEANVSTISIVGIGGMGKTTLAQSVYQFEKKDGHFECVMWVCVSDVFDIKLICQGIIQSATNKDCKISAMEGVKNKLKEEIDGKRYLLVLDDVWNEIPTEWLKLENLLLGGARGSKILVTTRTQLVANTVNSFSVHELKGLSPEESWWLFKKMAFQGGQPDSATKSETGKDVAEKCYGVPLALSAIGSALGLKKNDSEWLYFKKHNISNMTRDKKFGIMPILKLSYDYLPQQLKQCFTYCAVFPKDHTLYKDTLIEMWMAQGYIHPSERSETQEEVGEQYFVELLQRSFFQEYGKDYHDIVIYKMHDLIHDLAKSLAGSEVCSIGFGGDDVTTRHALVEKGNGNCQIQNAKNLRTYLSFKSIGTAREVNDVMHSFERIRVVTMRAEAKNFPSCIGRLIHLSYLDLCLGEFTRLPESICNLLNLQTLKLIGCNSLIELPRGTKNLVNLRHLDINGCSRLGHMPSGFGKLTSLQTLPNFVVGPQGGSLGEQLGEVKSVAANLTTKKFNVICSGLIETPIGGCVDYPLTLTHRLFRDSTLVRWL